MTHRTRTATLAATLAMVAVACLPATVQAKEVVSYFGTETGTGALGGEFKGIGEVAVNRGGAGPADKGDIYVVDAGNRRIQRFAQEDGGTPADPYDDSYPFVSAWGADVDGSVVGGSDYEICTVAAACKAGVESAGNGEAAGNGTFGVMQGIAVDQDTGEVYVLDRGANRVSVYRGDGVFLRSFGFDVAESGPGNTGTGYEVCVAADGDVCKAGTSGAGLGQLGEGRSIAVSQPDEGAASGTVFVGDKGNRRVNTYSLDGSSPGEFGSSAQFGATRLTAIAVDSRGIVYVGDINNDQEIDRYDSEDANGGGVGFLTSIPAPPLLPSNNNGTVGLEVDPDSDGVGPDSDVLYVLRTVSGEGVSSVIQQFGPINAPGLTEPPSAVDDTHGSLVEFSFVSGLDLDDTGRLFVSSNAKFDSSGPDAKSGVYVLDTAGGPASASLDSVGEVTESSAVLGATIDPNGPPPVSYHVEYSLDGSEWRAGPEVTVGSQEGPQAIEAVLDPPGTGLEPSTSYHVRLVVKKAFTPVVVTGELTFTTAASRPEVETVGSPIRTATTARLEGRVNPRNTAATFHFEYGTDGPCDSSACQATESVSAGSSGEVRFVSRQVTGLEPDTVYHYRLVADNGNPDGPAFGEDMTVRTGASDSPLSHGAYPGPPGSDRAWEQVNLPETGGNPVSAGYAYSDDGNRAIYQVPGGTPITDSGSAFNQFFAQRTASGWESKQILPPRSEVVGPNWPPPFADSTLSRFFALNANVTSGERAFWLLRDEGAPTKLYEGGEEYGDFFMASDDLSRRIAALKGEIDPAHAAPVGTKNFYDISSGAPRLVSLLPGDSVAECGVGGSEQAYGLQVIFPRRTDNWLSDDGSRLVFPSQGNDCGGESQLYLRDIGAAETVAVSGGPVSGPACGAAFIKGTPGAVFFWTQARLAAEDSAPFDCTGTEDGDVYRYDVASATLDCVTCLVPGLAADVTLSKGSSLGGAMTISVAEDGSRVYFRSPNRLLPGAAAPGAYRVEVDTGDLAYVAPLQVGDTVGDYVSQGNAVTPDGSVLTFRSSFSQLNPVGGTDNGGTEQYYRYDDRDRSLTCVSCPPDGSPAGAPVSEHKGTAVSSQVGPNSDPLSDGGDFAFTTPLALLATDQNTAGPGQEASVGNDLYEWRDGRLLLVSDGITSWPNSSLSPLASGMSPDGQDVYFTASVRLTPDAPDAYSRLYDARIGGGFDFPTAEKPCPLEACQGIPEGAPEQRNPATADYADSGNVRGTGSLARQCTVAARQVRRLSNRAKRLRAKAGRARDARRSRALRRRATKAARGARRRSAAAKRCRTRLARARRRAGR